MNPNLIKSHLNKTFQALWEASKSSRIDREIADSLRNRVKTAKERWQGACDPLEEKFNKYNEAGSWSQAKMVELAQVVYEGKAPDNVNLGDWVSVEIECLFPKKESETQFVAFLRKMGYTKLVTIKDDGSIHSDENNCECAREDDDGNELECVCDARNARKGYGREVVITFQYGNWKFVRDICNKLNELHCFVNKTCGLHVHFDCRHMQSHRQVGTVGRRIARTIPALKQILPPSRRDNRFCSVDINKYSPGRRRGSESRYAFVNLEAYGRHKTIEIRGHSGTTDSEKIISWIKLLRKIMDTRNTKSIQTVSELVSVFKLDNELSEYVIKRYSKFRGKTAEANVDDISDDNESADTVRYDLTEDQSHFVSLPVITNWNFRTVAGVTDSDEENYGAA